MCLAVPCTDDGVASNLCTRPGRRWDSNEPDTGKCQLLATAHYLQVQEGEQRGGQVGYR